MSDSEQRLRELSDSDPSDLLAYFQETTGGEYADRLDLELNLLPIDAALDWTEDFRKFHPLVAGLNGILLDDPNTSNHHVYLSHPACRGSILYLSHDGDSRIVFANLHDFVSTCTQSLATGEPLASYDRRPVILPEQQKLGELIDERLQAGSENDLAVVIALIPSLDLSDRELLGRLADQTDFFVVEALGNTIAERPRRELRPIAETCASHSHPQAADAGKRALAAIEKARE
jgi:hypothetical protein